MDNFLRKIGKVLNVCKHFLKKLVCEHDNKPRRGVVSKFSELEVVALSLTCETDGVDSEKRLFSMFETIKTVC